MVAIWYGSVRPCSALGNIDGVDMTKKLKRGLAVLLCVVVGVLALLGGLQLTVVYAENSWTNWYPTYEKIDIEEIIFKPIKTDEDYDVLYRQTGLTKLGVDGLVESEQYAQIIKIQDFYFKQHSVDCHSFFPFTYLETLASGWDGPLCDLEDGDVIISATTHSFSMRVGHAVIVVDGENKEVVESLCVGMDSMLTSARTMTGLANYMVLRPTGIPKQIRKEVAKYVKNEMLGLPYDLAIGVLSKKFPEKPTKTQCAHLVWYGYKKFGYDIDGNGGLIVKPRDFFQSQYFEVVQIFGFNPETLWS